MIKIFLLALLLLLPVKAVAQSDNDSDFIKIEVLFNEISRFNVAIILLFNVSIGSLWPLETIACAAK